MSRKSHIRLGPGAPSLILIFVVLSMAVLGIPVLILAKRALKTNKGLALAGFILIPVVVGLLIFLEFQIDRTETNRYLLYGIYALALAAPTVVGFLLAGNE